MHSLPRFVGLAFLASVNLLRTVSLGFVQSLGATSSTAPSLTCKSSVRFSTRRRLLWLAPIAFLFAIAFLPAMMLAQGEDNPTGVSGIYNGNITTGGNYDQYTGNAMRAVDNIVVPGSVGAYPLKWTRYFNSRGGLGSNWTFSYKDYRITSCKLCTNQSMGFPDGRMISISGGSCVSGVEEGEGSWTAPDRSE